MAAQRAGAGRRGGAGRAWSGDDAAGERVREALAAAGVEAACSSSPPAGRPTTVKTRIIAHHQQVVRADREQADDISAALEAELLDACGAGAALGLPARWWCRTTRRASSPRA